MLRERTPILSREIEQQTKANGPVITYTLSQEELAKYRSGELDPPTNSDGKKMRSAGIVWNPPSTKPKKEEEKQVEVKIEKGVMPSRVDFLKMIASGMNISQAQKKININSASLYQHLNKWGLKGIKPDRAQQLLDEMVIDGEVEAKPDPAPAAKPGEESASNQKYLEENYELRDKLTVAESNLETLKKFSAELENENSELKKQLEVLKNEDGKFAEARNSMLNEFRQAEDERLRLREENIALKAELTMYENQDRADTDRLANDPVNHPSHYTQGSVECIDAIESATIGLEGVQAYSTGAAIKYLWRWSRKNGAEDLAKARWYVDKLIGVVDQSVKESVWTKSECATV